MSLPTLPTGFQLAPCLKGLQRIFEKRIFDPPTQDPTLCHIGLKGRFTAKVVQLHSTLQKTANFIEQLNNPFKAQPICQLKDNNM